MIFNSAPILLVVDDGCERVAVLGFRPAMHSDQNSKLNMSGVEAFARQKS